jgi:hypothetical protein
VIQLTHFAKSRDFRGRARNAPRRLRRSWRGRGQQDAAVTRRLKLSTGRLQWLCTRNLYNDAKKT